MTLRSIKEVAKEALRIAIFGALSALVSWLATNIASLDPTSTYAIVGTIVLRLIDKGIHKSPSSTNGLLPF